MAKPTKSACEAVIKALVAKGREWDMPDPVTVRVDDLQSRVKVPAGFSFQVEGISRSGSYTVRITRMADTCTDEELKALASELGGSTGGSGFYKHILISRR